MSTRCRGTLSKKSDLRVNDCEVTRTFPKGLTGVKQWNITGDDIETQREFPLVVKKNFLKATQ